VRVLTNCFGAACANILVRVYTTVGGRSYLVEEFPMLNFVAGTRVYDVIGTNVAAQLVNNTGGVVSNIGVAVFGRANWRGSAVRAAGLGSRAGAGFALRSVDPLARL
jgi:hypothetical protein